MVGSLSGRTLEGVGPVLGFVAVGLGCALANLRSLNNLVLGTDLARGLGERLWRARLMGLGAVTFLTAAAVALTGPIGFIGLTAPHVARALVGGQAEVAVGVVLAILGGLAFVVIVRRTRLAAL